MSKLTIYLFDRLVALKRICLNSRTVSEFAKVFKRLLNDGWGNNGIAWTLEGLQDTAGLSATTYSRWANGKTEARRHNVQLLCGALALDETKRQELLDALDSVKKRKETAQQNAKERNQFADTLVFRDEHFSSLTVVDFLREVDEMRRRNALKLAGAAVGGVALSPISDAAATLDTSDRYVSIRTVSELAGVIPRNQRLVLLRDLDHACFKAVEEYPTPTKHMFASMVACQRAISLRYNEPRNALEIAVRARIHAKEAGYNVVRLWAATAHAIALKHVGDFSGAISALEPVIQLKPERGTMRVLAASILAEAYASIGDAPNATRALDVAVRARDEVRQTDAFGGAMAYSIGEQLSEAARVNLLLGDYENADRQANDALSYFTSKTLEPRAYINSLYTTIAIAASRVEELDKAVEFANLAAERTRAYGAVGGTDLLVSELQRQNIASEACMQLLGARNLEIQMSARFSSFGLALVLVRMTLGRETSASYRQSSSIFAGP